MGISTITTRLLAKSRCGHFCPLFDIIVIQSYETALYWLLFYYISYQWDQQDLVQAKYILSLQVHIFFNQKSSLSKIYPKNTSETFLSPFQICYNSMVKDVKHVLLVSQCSSYRGPTLLSVNGSKKCRMFCHHHVKTQENEFH